MGCFQRLWLAVRSVEGEVWSAGVGEDGWRERLWRVVVVVVV